MLSSNDAEMLDSPMTAVEIRNYETRDAVDYEESDNMLGKTIYCCKEHEKEDELLRGEI